MQIQICMHGIGQACGFSTLSILTLLLVFTASTLSSNLDAWASQNQDAGQETSGGTSLGSNATSIGIQLSKNPIYEERVVTQAAPLNQTHSQLRMTGNGTLMLPNDTQQFSTMSNGTASVSMFGVASGSEVLTMLDDNTENATLTFREMVRFDTMDGKSKGFVIAVMETESGGPFAQLDEVPLVGQTEFQTDGVSKLTLWEWQRN
jgi:hypothetical protein